MQTDDKATFIEFPASALEQNILISDHNTNIFQEWILWRKIARLNIGAKCSKFLLLNRLPTLILTYLLNKYINILSNLHICKFANLHANTRVKTSLYLNFCQAQSF